MALINCPACHKRMSNKAVTCPHCGYKLGKAGAAAEPVIATAPAEQGADEQLLKLQARKAATLNYRLQMAGMIGVVAFAAGGYLWYVGMTEGDGQRSHLGQLVLAGGFVTYVFARGWILWNRHGHKFKR